MAQSVEQLIRNQQVAGSSPASSSKKTDFCVKMRKNRSFFCVLDPFLVGFGEQFGEQNRSKTFMVQGFQA